MGSTGERLFSGSGYCLGLVILNKRRCVTQEDKRSPIVGMVKGLVGVCMRQILFDRCASIRVVVGEAPDAFGIEPVAR